MLASVWVQLKPLETSQLNVHAGCLAHAAFLDLLHQVDPALAQVLHDLNQRKPFTLSSLVEIEPETADYRAGGGNSSPTLSSHHNQKEQHLKSGFLFSYTRGRWATLADGGSWMQPHLVFPGEGRNPCYALAINRNPTAILARF